MLVGNKNSLWGKKVVDTTSFITKWDMLSGVELKLPTRTGYSYNCTVDWGDGTETTITSFDDVNNSHTYSADGIYTVTINGVFEAFTSFNYTNSNNLVDVTQFGNNILYYLNFKGCINLNITATDIPIFAVGAYCHSLFAEIGTVNVTNLDNWDVSNVVNFERAFLQAQFSNNLFNWDISSAISLNSMFYASSFNSPINHWNTANVRDMSRMFYQCPFNQYIGDWNVEKVTDTYQMFLNATSYNQPFTNWNTIALKNMSYMFLNANSFNQSLAHFNISKLTTALGMINRAIYSTANYDALLIGWQGQPHPTGRTLSVSQTYYTLGGAAEVARTALIADGWTINDLGGI